MELIVYTSGSKGNCYELEEGKSRILLECGLSPKKFTATIAATPGEYAGVLVTHEHMDHARSAKHCLSIGMPVYMTEGTAAALEMPVMPNLHLIKANEEFDVGVYTVHPLRVFHDAEEPVCFVIHSNISGDNTLFATDTGYMYNTVSGMDIMAVECNYSERYLETSSLADVVKGRIRRSHMSIERLMMFLDSCDLTGTRDICLLHLSDHHSISDEFAQRIQDRYRIPVRVA